MVIRLVGPSQVLFEVFPRDFQLIYIAITTLGSVVFLIGVLSIAYWTDSRRATARVIADALIGFATIITLKFLFMLPRPPNALLQPASSGFPSGHAVAAVVVYGGFVLEYDWIGYRNGLAIAGLVLAIGLSRIALRVHYLGDVLVGIVVGIALLGGTRLLAGSDPTPAFTIASMGGATAVVVTGGDPQAWGALGAALAGVVSTAAIGQFPSTATIKESVTLVAVGTPIVFLLYIGGQLFLNGSPAAGLDEFGIVLFVLLLPTMLSSGLQAVGLRTNP